MPLLIVTSEVCMRVRKLAAGNKLLPATLSLHVGPAPMVCCPTCRHQHMYGSLEKQLIRSDTLSADLGHSLQQDMKVRQQRFSTRTRPAGPNLPSAPHLTQPVRVLHPQPALQCPSP